MSEAPVVKPNHYKVIIKGLSFDCLDIIQALDLGFELGNAMKYIWRAGRKTKSAKEDIMKAREYLDRYLERNQ